MTGTEGKPMRMGASIIDMVAAILGVAKVLQLLSENKSGLVEIGLFETAMFLTGQHIYYGSTHSQGFAFCPCHIC